MMKKKMKGIAAASVEMAPAPAPASAFSRYDDQRFRFRHQSLLQDYQELLKEVEAKKNKLRMMKRKKLTLQSEVRFLRRRHQFLTCNQPSTMDQNSAKAQFSQLQSKKKAKERNYSRKAAALPRSPLGVDLNNKGKAYNEKEATLRNPHPVYDSNQKLKTYHGKESTLQNSTMVLDLNQKERVHGPKEAAAQNATPVFDLNQISREEEELQFNSEPWRVEESKNSSVRGSSDEQLNDIKLSACRNIGNRANRAGKRKISWQDQVALRV